jgi:hypothetical protein
VTLHSNTTFRYSTPHPPRTHTMRFPPPDVRGTWPKPNYVNPITRSHGLMITELTLVPIALICVLLRLWIRIGWLHKSWWDDWLMVAAMVGSLCYCYGIERLLTGRQIWSCLTTALVIMAVSLYGWNIHVWDAKTEILQNGRKVQSPRLAVRRLLPYTDYIVRLPW